MEFFRDDETISTSSIEQRQSIGELSRAITQIDSSTQQNASMVQELAGTLGNLRAMAAVLAEDVKKFKTGRRKSCRIEAFQISTFKPCCRQCAADAGHSSPLFDIVVYWVVERACPAYAFGMGRGLRLLLQTNLHLLNTHKGMSERSDG